MGMLPPVFVELKASIGEFSSKMKQAEGEIKTLQSHGSSSFTKLAAVGKGALLGVGAAAIGIGVIAVKMADEYETSHARLEASLKNSGTNWETYKGRIEAADKTQEKYGYTAAQTEEALGNLTTALGSPKKALEDLSLVTDLAKYKHIDLAEAATLVAKAQEGNLKPLKAMGIDLPIVAGGAVKLMQAHANLGKATDAATAFLAKHKDAVKTSSKFHDAYEAKLGKVKDAQKKVNDVSNAGTDIIKVLGDKMHGQADAAAGTLAGQIDGLKASTEDMFKTLGLKLIPKLVTAIDTFKEFAGLVSRHKKVFEVLATVIGVVLVAAIAAYLYSLALATATSIAGMAKDIAAGVGWVLARTAQFLGIAAVSTGAAAESTAAWTAADVASGGILIAIGLLIVGMVYVVKNWSKITKAFKADVDKLRELWNTAFDFIHRKVSEFVTWIKGHWKLLLAILTGPIGIAVLIISQHWQTIKDKAAGAVDWIKTKFDSIVDFFKGLPKKITAGAKGLWDGLTNGLASAVDWVRGKINDVIDLFNKPIKWINDHNGPLPDVPYIPHLASGGIVTSATTALIGEAGPEAVIPLSRMGSMMGGNITINVHAGAVGSEEHLSRTIVDALNKYQRRGGRLQFTGA